MMSLDCTESYSVNQNDEAPALRGPNDNSFIYVRVGGIVWVKGRGVGEHYFNSLTYQGVMFCPLSLANLFVFRN